MSGISALPSTMYLWTAVASINRAAGNSHACGAEPAHPTPPGTDGRWEASSKAVVLLTTPVDSSLLSTLRVHLFLPMTSSRHGTFLGLLIIHKTTNFLNACHFPSSVCHPFCTESFSSWWHIEQHSLKDIHISMPPDCDLLQFAKWVKDFRKVKLSWDIWLNQCNCEGPWRMEWGSREIELWMPCCWLKRLWEGRKMQLPLEAIEDETGSLWSLEREHLYARFFWTQQEGFWTSDI